MLSENDVVDPHGSHLETESLRLDFIKGLFKFHKSTRHSHSPSSLTHPLHSPLSTLTHPLHCHWVSILRGLYSQFPTLILSNPHPHWNPRQVIHFLNACFVLWVSNFFLVFVLVGSQKVDLVLSRIWVFLYFFVTLIICWWLLNICRQGVCWKAS